MSLLSLYLDYINGLMCNLVFNNIYLIILSVCDSLVFSPSLQQNWYHELHVLRTKRDEKSGFLSEKSECECKQCERIMRFKHCEDPSSVNC